MNTPIYDFVSKYIESKAARMHMPGHKGIGPLGAEQRDITEITGADVLSDASGIIAESEQNASRLFGTAHTFYSTEGSTLVIKSMLYLALAGRKAGTPPIVLAARNVHKAFVNAAALLDLSVRWVGEDAGHICKQNVTPKSIKAALGSMEVHPFAVYVTSPDYLGNLLDIRGISEVCREAGVPLLVDNAHGAYLAFLEEDLHPIKLGAAMCADSAHKTLPVLTGGAYLHISPSFAEYVPNARRAMSLFASTSPSYLTLQSLDLCNKYLDDGYSERLVRFVHRLSALRLELAALGVPAEQGEPLKLTFRASDFCKSGLYFADKLRAFGIECEMADDDYVILMLTPELHDEMLSRITDCARSIDIIPPRERGIEIYTEYPKAVMSIREAIMSPSEMVPVSDSVGRIAASPTVGCPPAVPIVISGELIDEHVKEMLEHYGIRSIAVVKPSCD